MAGSRILAQAVQLHRQPPRAASLDPDCVLALKALGEDTRVRIVALLIDTPLDVGEISTRSKHLGILREAGLLQVEKAGRRHLYALAPGIRKQASDGRVLDLGCCSFRFEHPARNGGPTTQRTTRRKQSLGTGARSTR